LAAPADRDESRGGRSAGSDQFLYGKVGGDQVIARLDPQFKVAVRDRLRLSVNMRRLHLCDVETERAVL
jgi:ABC-type sugar transport system ATPase subunit